MSLSQTFEWFGRFKDARILTVNNSPSGRTNSVINSTKMKQANAAVLQDRRHTIPELCTEFGIIYGFCQPIRTEQLNMHRIAAKFMPKVLTQDQ